MVHELVHVAQSASAPATEGAPLLSRPGDASERQAHAVTDRFMKGMAHPGFHPVRPTARIGLVPELWYRGYAEGAPPPEKGWVHDLGEGHYFSDSPDAAEEYATTRAQGNPALRRVARGIVDPAKLGRVLDLTKEKDFMTPFKHTKEGVPGVSEGLPSVSGEPYANLLKGFLQKKNLKLEDFELIIGPEGVRGGRQMCIRNAKTAAQVLAGMTHSTPGGAPPSSGSGGPPPEGGRIAPGSAPKPPAAGKASPTTAPSGPATGGRAPAQGPARPAGRPPNRLVGGIKTFGPMILGAINSYLMAREEAKRVPGRVEKALADQELQERSEALSERKRLEIARAQRHGQRRYLTVQVRLVFTNGIQDSLTVSEPSITEGDWTETSAPVRMSDDPVLGTETSVGWVITSALLEPVRISRSEEIGFRIEDLQARPAEASPGKRGEKEKEIARLQAEQSAALQQEDQAALAEICRPEVVADPRARTRQQTRITDILSRLGKAGPAPRTTTPPIAPVPQPIAPAPPSISPTPLLPGAPAGDVVARAAAVVAELRREGNRLEAEARTLETRMGTATPPSPAERKSFLDADARWRLTVKYAMNVYKDTNRPEALDTLAALLDRLNPILTRTRSYLGG